MVRASEQGCLAPTDGQELANGGRESAPENFLSLWCCDSEVSLFCFVILGLIHLLSVFVHLWQVQLGAEARFEAFSPKQKWMNKWMVSGFQYSSAAGDVRVSHSLRAPHWPASWLPCLLCTAVVGAMLGTPWNLDLSQLLPRWRHTSDGNFCTAREDFWGDSYMRSTELKYKCTLVMSQYLSP